MNHFLKRAWAEINLDALQHNYNVIRNHIGKSKLMCVIKADAYGHGSVKIAQEYERLGADFFGVSNLEEALQLRQNGINTPILILGYTPEEEAHVLSSNNISQSVFSLDYAKKLSENAAWQNVKVKIHLKLDTGMSRIGLLCQNDEQIKHVVSLAEEICKLPSLTAQGIFTHFACADEGENGKSQTMHQFEIFSKVVKMLEERAIHFDIKHCSNSGAIADYPQAHLDMVRAGIILYGLSSSNLTKKLDLQPVMQVKSVISHVKTVPINTPVSYGQKYITDRETRLATIPIGYADGYSRSLSNNGFVLVHGKKAPILGRVCMDQIIVDITDIENVARADEVIIFGNTDITADTLAELSNTINYEIVCLVGKRVPRVYYKNGKMVDAINGLIRKDC